MSKYTTQVRFICETAAGLDESTGFSNVDQVLDGSWASIFTSDVKFFEESYRKELCKKILKHYYLREIGCETIGIWKLWMNTKLEEIMPYYNQVYESTLWEFEPLEDVNVTTTHQRDTAGNKNDKNQRDTNVTGTGSADGSSNGDEWNKFSDTPQGSVANVDNSTYLTDARNITTENGYQDHTQTSSDTHNTEELDHSYSDQEKFGETIKGKRGGGTYSEMIMKYREALLNVDMMVIREFEDLFLKLW